MTPSMVLVAHGTRSPRGVETIAAVAEKVSTFVPDVRTAFVDVLGPSPAEVLRTVCGPAVVVPAFLASGYHVHADIPRQVAESGRPDVTIGAAMGPDPALVRTMHRRLCSAGWRRGDAVVLAAAGSSDERAVRDVHRAAAMLQERVGRSVDIGYVATGSPRVSDVVERLRRSTARRVYVASYLLAHGLFQQRLDDVEADGVAAPLGADPAVVALLVARYRAAVRESARVRAR